MIKTNNLKLNETIFLGDSNHEIEEAKEVGILSGAITWGFTSKERLEALKPDFVISNLEELKSVVLEN